MHRSASMAPWWSCRSLASFMHLRRHLGWFMCLRCTGQRQAGGVTMAVGMRGVIAEMIATMTVAVAAVMAMYSAEIAGFSPD